MPAPLEGDRKAGLIGLAVGAVFLLVVLYSVVHITNRHYALFVMNSITGVPLKDIVRDSLPFLVAMIGALALITFVPDLVLYLPRVFGYKG